MPMSAASVRLRMPFRPILRTFREFPKFVDTELDPQKHRKIAMFCTGGIPLRKGDELFDEAGL